MKKLFLLFVLTLLPMMANASYDAEIDGIFYNLNTDTKEATVVNPINIEEEEYYDGRGAYSDEVVIPHSITWGGIIIP